jgi:hypothetical protein
MSVNCCMTSAVSANPYQYKHGGDGVSETKSRVAWAWMCQQPSFNIHELATAAGYLESHAQRVVHSWVNSGHLLPVAGSGVCRDPILYAVVDIHREPRMGKGRVLGESPRKIRKKTGQQKMWNTMKIAQRFTIRDLSMTAGVGEGSAGIYVNRLVQAGYLRIFRPVNVHQPNRLRRGQLTVYQLVRNTGRLAPMVRSAGCWDQNEQGLYPFTLKSEASHEQDVA